jgi:transposase-like protein
MNIMDRARTFVESIIAIERQRDRDRRRCPTCGRAQVYRHGSYTRHPWALKGRQSVSVQRYRCQACGAAHSEEHANLVRGGWYGRDVRRYTMDQWLHGGSSLRRVAEHARSLIGHQERWHLWHVGSGADAERPRCRLSHSIFTPAQDRHERRRCYRHPGKCACKSLVWPWKGTAIRMPWAYSRN